MKKSLVTLALLAAAGFANAQAFTDPPTCYSWQGGNFSAGSFSRCGPTVIVIPAPPAPAPVAALPPPVVQSPIMMPMSAPVSKPLVLHPKRKPKPRLICKPA